MRCVSVYRVMVVMLSVMCCVVGIVSSVSGVIR